jgi:hypothetical protein
MTRNTTAIAVVAVSGGLLAAWSVHAWRLAALSRSIPDTTSYIPTSNPWTDQTRYGPLYETPDPSIEFPLPDYP